MIVDAEDPQVSLDRHAEVVIVGAGPAGLALARELGSAYSVLIVEAGGLEDEPSQQALLEGDSVGITYPLTETRARQFGGSGQLWAGWCARFDAADFAQRSWVPDSGWPIEFESVATYYDRAARTLNIIDPMFDAHLLCALADIEFPFEDESVVATVWRFGRPTVRFGQHWRDEFEHAGDVQTVLHATVTDIELDAEHGAVAALQVRTFTGRQGRITADVFVLACGGIETARLLLNSRSQVPQGAANSSGLVGRHFMEHPHRQIDAIGLHLGEFESWTGRGVTTDTAAFRLCVGLSRAAQEDRQVMNARAHVYRTPRMSPHDAPRVGLFMEQAPSPDSRAVLSDKVDRLGMNKIRLDWRLNRLDWMTYERTAEMLAHQFERAGAKLVPASSGLRSEQVPVLHSNHHLGMTRMSRTAEGGVVDTQCRAHDLENLFIIGGGVFPTVSWANPTLTLLALTFRLADHLVARRASGRQ